LINDILVTQGADLEEQLPDEDMLRRLIMASDYNEELEDVDINDFGQSFMK